MTYKTLILLLIFTSSAFAEDILQKPEEFISQSFAGNPPAPKIFDIPEDLKKPISKIMKRKYRLGKVEYWLKDGRSVWILEEIGKVKPITTGFIVNNNKLEEVKVLIYRESHGWEVKYPFFTDQFKEVTLDGKRLSEYIDGISGATLSVNALKRMAALALFLHKQVTENTESTKDE